jgi:polysaccharide pyruvyl transferase WcaK-like protein
MTTPNAGNEALSIELIRFFRRELPDAEIRAIDRYPPYLAHFTVGAIDKAPNKFALLDKQADYLIRRGEMWSGGELSPIADEKLIRVVQPGKEPPSPIKNLKRRLGFRRNLARFGLIGKSELSRAVATCAHSDVLVWNPAGEFHPTGSRDEVFRLLLMVRLAQRLGKRTVVVNHSIEIADPLLRDLVSYVYRQADFIVVRDKKSYAEAIKLGVNSKRLGEAPDMVFVAADNIATDSDNQRDLPQLAPIGLSINGVEAYSGTNEWDKLLYWLASLNRPLVFISNAMHRDRAFAEDLQKRHQIHVPDHQPTYTELQTTYSCFGALVASRLHSSILAISSGTPVISIEPSVFKLTAIFEQMSYPYGTEDPRRRGWADRVATKITHALSHRREVSAFGRAAAITQARLIREQYRPVFSLMQNTR